MLYSILSYTIKVLDEGEDKEDALCVVDEKPVDWLEVFLDVNFLAKESLVAFWPFEDASIGPQLLVVTRRDSYPSSSKVGKIKSQSPYALTTSSSSVSSSTNCASYSSSSSSSSSAMDICEGGWVGDEVCLFLFKGLKGSFVEELLETCFFKLTISFDIVLRHSSNLPCHKDLWYFSS